MGMFDNYKNIDPGYIPDNRHRCIPCRCNRIVSGGTNTLVFELDKSYNEGLVRLSIVFRQEDRLYMEREPATMTVDGDRMFVECHLDSTESRAFGGTPLDTLVQLRLEYRDSTLFTEIEHLAVMPTLEKGGTGQSQQL